MLTLQNFEKQLDQTILQRGKQYYQQKAVGTLEESEKDTWMAEVEGSETYTVEVTLKDNNEISGYFCDCPYDGTCKHVAAVFFALRDEIKTQQTKPTKTPKKDIFENLLQTINAKEFQDFVRSYATKNKNFKTEFELFFAEKDNRIDVEKKYDDLIRKIISKYTERGFIHYRASFGLSKEIDKMLDGGTANAAKNNFKDAFALAKVVLKAMMEAITACDDSNGYLGGTIDNAINLFAAIAEAKTAAIDIKDQVFYFLRIELNDKEYFNYGDFGYNLFSIFQNLAVQLNKPEAFLGFIDTQIPKLIGDFENYRKEYYQKSKIEFLKATGKTEEAGKLVLQNLDIVEVRQGEVNNAIDKKDFAAAKKLIAGGIKIANEKNHPGTVSQWEKELLRIAVLEKDISTIRHYTKYFAFDRGFSKDYYQQWKKTFPVAEWKEVIESHIEKTIEKITYDWSQKKNSYWRPSNHPPLLEGLAPVYIEEKYWDRLLALVQQANNLNTTLGYHSYLVSIYPTELLKLYLPALEEYGLKSNGRSDYAYLAEKMKTVMKDIPEGKEKIVAIAQSLIQKFSYKPRRPAMIEELNKVLK